MITKTWLACSGEWRILKHVSDVWKQSTQLRQLLCVRVACWFFITELSCGWDDDDASQPARPHLLNPELLLLLLLLQLASPTPPSGQLASGSLTAGPRSVVNLTELTRWHIIHTTHCADIIAITPPDEANTPRLQQYDCSQQHSACRPDVAVVTAAALRYQHNSMSTDQSQVRNQSTDTQIQTRLPMNRKSGAWCHFNCRNRFEERLKVICLKVASKKFFFEL